MLKNTVLRVHKRSPFRYVFVRSLDSSIPQNMVNNKAHVINMFTKAIDKLYENKLLASVESDDAKLQRKKFINDVVSRYQESFLDIDMSNERFPVGVYLLKVNNRNTRAKCEICSELTIKLMASFWYLYC